MIVQDGYIRYLLRTGEKISAIKRYRELYGVGLKEAVEAIEAMLADDGIGDSPSPKEQWMQITDLTFRDALEALLRKGELIAALKLYREQRSEQLPYAKRMVLAWHKMLQGGRALAAEGEKEPVEHFDIRWSEALHSERRGFFSKQEAACLEVRIELLVGAQIISDPGRISWPSLWRSARSDGKYTIFTEDEEDQQESIEIVHLEGRVLWYDAWSEKHWHLFDENYYVEAIRVFEEMMLLLPTHYPNMPILFIGGDKR